MSSTKDEIIAEVKNLKRKSAFQQHCHGKLSQEASRRAKIWSVIVIMAAGFAMVATTAEARTLFGPGVDEAVLRRVAAFLSITVFIMTLLNFSKTWENQAAKHYASGEAFTSILRRIDFFLRAADDKTAEELDILVGGITEEYTNICKNAPTIPDNRILKLKQDHRQNVMISKYLDENPFTPIKQIREQLGKDVRED